jgi:hypothetical protein
MKTFRKIDVIKPTKLQGFPKRLVFLDTETTEHKVNTKISELSFKMGALIYVELDKNAEIIKREIVQLYNRMDFFNWYNSTLYDRRPIYFFAHNIGFDLRILECFHEFAKMGLESEPPIVNDRTFIWIVKNIGQTLYFLDTANFAVQTVEQLGNDMNLPKLPMPDKNAPMSDWEAYNVQDCVILELFIVRYIQWLHTNQLGQFKLTLASQTMTTWRHKFMTVNVHIHNVMKFIELERTAYHGGRTECFYIKEFKNQHFYNLDVNSMYPYVMRNKQLPTKFVKTYKRIDPKDVLRQEKDYYFIATVKLKTDENAYPLMHNNRLCFPVGSFETVLHHSELIYAIKHKHVAEIGLTAVYDKGYIARDYIDFMYNMKIEAEKNGDKSTRYFAKIAMNSWYGKWGQTNVSREIYDTPDSDDIGRICYSYPAKRMYGQILNWFGSTVVELRSGETSISFPAIAGAVTAESRMHLYHYMQIAGIDNVYYVDTDSIITNKMGYNNLYAAIDTTKLGYLKLEGEANYLEIRGNKDYNFGDKSRTKGKSKNAIDIKANVWEQIQFEGISQWLNIGGKSTVRITKIVKRRSFNYTKGKVNEKTGKIFPFVF